MEEKCGVKYSRLCPRDGESAVLPDTISRELAVVASQLHSMSLSITATVHEVTREISYYWHNSEIRYYIVEGFLWRALWRALALYIPSKYQRHK